jgi:hypothetical protein
MDYDELREQVFDWESPAYQRETGWNYPRPSHTERPPASSEGRRDGNGNAAYSLENEFVAAD